MVGAIVVAAALGFALGTLPALMSATDDIRFIFAAVALIFVGSLLVPGVAAWVIGASPDGRRRIGLAVLIVAVATAIILSMLSAGTSFTDAMPVAVLLSLVTVGALVGYSVGARYRA